MRPGVRSDSVLRSDWSVDAPATPGPMGKPPVGTAASLAPPLVLRPRSLWTLWTPPSSANWTSWSKPQSRPGYCCCGPEPKPGCSLKCLAWLRQSGPGCVGPVGWSYWRLVGQAGWEGGFWRAAGAADGGHAGFWAGSGPVHFQICPLMSPFAASGGSGAGLRGGGGRHLQDGKGGVLKL